MYRRQAQIPHARVLDIEDQRQKPAQNTSSAITNRLPDSFLHYFCEPDEFVLIEKKSLYLIFVVENRLKEFWKRDAQPIEDNQTSGLNSNDNWGGQR